MWSVRSSHGVWGIFFLLCNEMERYMNLVGASFGLPVAAKGIKSTTGALIRRYPTGLRFYFWTERHPKAVLLVMQPTDLFSYCLYALQAHKGSQLVPVSILHLRWLLLSRIVLSRLAGSLMPMAINLPILPN